MVQAASLKRDQANALRGSCWIFILIMRKYFLYIGNMNLDTQLAKRIRTLRKERGFSLEQLAERSSVSRSMISLIERAETSATAAVLNKLADALGVNLASLFDEEAAAGAALPLARAAEQQVWQDPASGYVRRHLSPHGFGSPLELAEVSFPPAGRVVFDNAMRSIITHQQLWMLEGEMEITLEGQVWLLQPSDCLAMTLGQQIIFHNPGSQPARYLLALTATSSFSGR